MKRTIILASALALGACTQAQLTTATNAAHTAIVDVIDIDCHAGSIAK